MAQVGATITLLLEEIMKRAILIDSFEATVFGLGLYTDTGSFSYEHTTSRDLDAASFLFRHGLDLDIVKRFSDMHMTAQEELLFQRLMQKGAKRQIDGVTLFLTCAEQENYQSGLAYMTEKLLEATGTDAALTVVKMARHIYIVARSHSERIDIRSLARKFGGDGHEQAAAATVKKCTAYRNLGRS